MDIGTWSETDFAKLCVDIMDGLGLSGAQAFPSEGVERAYRKKLVRGSTDGMFRTDETWLCLFVRSGAPLDEEKMEPLTRAAIAGDMGYLLVVVFGGVTEAAAAELRATLALENVQVVLLTGALAEALGHAGWVDFHRGSVGDPL